MAYKKNNILYYEPTSGYGGSSRCLLAWLKKINRNRYFPIVVVHDNGPAIQEMAEISGYFIRIPFKKILPEELQPPFSYFGFILNFLFFYIPTTFYLLILAKRMRVDLFHLNAKIKSVIPGILAAKFLRLPCVCHIHDISKPLFREILFGKLASCLVVLTPKAMKFYKGFFQRQRLELVSNGICLSDYSAGLNGQILKDSLGIRLDDKVIGIAGRLVEGKGFDDFIRAAEIVCSRKSNVKFLIVGAAPKGQENYDLMLKSMVNAAGLDSRVIFTGWRDDVKDLMSICDILVQASSTFPEGFPLVCIEALALSKPLIVTNVPGSSEAVVDGVSGIVIPPADPEELSLAIEKLLSNDILMKQLGEDGRKRVEEFFDLEKALKKLDEIYYSLLN